MEKAKRVNGNYEVTLFFLALLLHQSERWNLNAVRLNPECLQEAVLAEAVASSLPAAIDNTVQPMVNIGYESRNTQKNIPNCCIPSPSLISGRSYPIAATGTTGGKSGHIPAGRQTVRFVNEKTTTNLGGCNLRPKWPYTKRFGLFCKTCH